MSQEPNQDNEWDETTSVKDLSELFTDDFIDDDFDDFDTLGEFGSQDDDY